ncbi:hypothetical protein MPLA_1900002 [Mesorhizobium sp. ORS 3359]|nr:hypothetical protein MPLA_1900002 [Mesorhizobium sp. ORS 3359]
MECFYHITRGSVMSRAEGLKACPARWSAAPELLISPTRGEIGSFADGALPQLLPLPLTPQAPFPSAQASSNRSPTPHE